MPMDHIASYFIEIKKRLDEQTIVLEKILATIEKTNQESFTETNDNPPVSISTDEERLMRRHGITKQGKKYYFSSYSYETLSDAIAYAEILATKASTGNLAEQKEVSISSKIPADKGGTLYCRNCGKEVKEKAEICHNCGVRPLAEKKFCQECGVDTNPSQEICIKCGIRLKTLMPIARNGFPVNTDFSGLIPYYKEEFTRIHESNESYKGKWNWAAFFLGPIWALTKGVWLSVIICILISVVTGGVGGIIYWFVFGFRGNYMYYARHVKDKQLPI